MKKTNKIKPSQLEAVMSSVDVQTLLLDRAKEAVLSTAVELIEQDMIRLCGDPFARKKKGLCHRGGSEFTSLMVDGAKMSFRKPRARKNGREVDLPTLSALRDQDLLDQQMLDRLLRGVSTRNYGAVINGFSDKTGISKSSVSRAFKRASKKHLDEINSADLSGHQFVAILIDGTALGSGTQVVAVGITDQCEKVPLGLREGDTENSVVVMDLLNCIKDRGFKFCSSRLLCVLDGGKALRSAVRKTWGEAALVQRCWLHKLRNIQDYLPKEHHGQVWRRFKRMMNLNSHADAKKELGLIRDWLSTLSSGAENSLLEAGEELLTVHRLELTGDFRNSLATTNIIESLIGVVKNKVGRVKFWGLHPAAKNPKASNTAARWAAAAIQEHRKKMRKLKGGMKQIEKLKQNLNQFDNLSRSA